MSKIRAAQLVYTRVEPAYSAQRKSGFQTVYKSESLAPDEVNAIEKRIQCFQPHQPEIIRRQFFTLDNGNVVLARSVVIDSDPEIVDKDRRKGVFLAHCLVLNPTELSKVEENPFAIFNHYHFLDDAKEMVEAYGQSTGMAPVVIIEVERSRSNPSTTWPGLEARKLVTLALQAETILKKDQSVLFVGQGYDIEEALRMIFFLLPKNTRRICTFDTCVDRCAVRPGLYWAVGTTVRQSASSYIEVNAAERRVVGAIEDTLHSQDIYWIWLKSASAQENFSTIMERANQIQKLDQAFADRVPPSWNEIDEEACQDFLRLAEVQVMQNLRSAVAKRMGKSFAQLFSTYLQEVLEAKDLLHVAATQHIPPAKLSSFVTDWIVKMHSELNDKAVDWKAIHELARQVGDMRLLYLSATLGKKIDTEVRDEALRSMDAKTFRHALEQLLDPIAPADFVTPTYLSLLLQDSRLGKMNSEQFLDLVKVIIKVGGTHHLDALVKYIRSLENEYLTQLEKMVTKCSDDVPQEFNDAINSRREEVGPPPSFLSFLRK